MSRNEKYLPTLSGLVVLLGFGISTRFFKSIFEIDFWKTRTVSGKIIFNVSRVCRLTFNMYIFCGGGGGGALCVENTKASIVVFVFFGSNGCELGGVCGISLIHCVGD